MKLPSGRYFGEILKRIEVTGLPVLEGRYSPHLKLPKHSHEYPHFTVLLQGLFTEVSSKRSWHWTPFSFGFNPPDEEHTGLVQQAGAHFLIVETPPAWLQHAFESSRPLARTVVIRGGLATSLGVRLYKEVQRPDEVSPLAIEGLVLELMAETSRECNRVARNRPPRWLGEARELIHMKFTESLRLSTIAESVGVHPVHLARMFRKTYLQAHCGRKEA